VHYIVQHTFIVAFQSLIKYISELGIPGAILIFLPGWNIIFALGRHLGQHPVIGKTLPVIAINRRLASDDILISSTLQAV